MAVGVKESISFSILTVRPLGTVFGSAICKWGTSRVDIKNLSAIGKRNMIDGGKPGGISGSEISNSRAERVNVGGVLVTSVSSELILRNNSGGRIAECTT